MRIKSSNTGRVGAVFKMKDVINGLKKSGQDPTAIRYPKSGELIVSSEEIKIVTLAYCVDNLTRRSQGRLAQLKNDLNHNRMKSNYDNGFEILEKDFEEVVKRFASKTTKSYDFLLKAGEYYKRAMYHLCKRMGEN